VAGKTPIAMFDLQFTEAVRNVGSALRCAKLNALDYGPNKRTWLLTTCTTHNEAR